MQEGPQEDVFFHVLISLRTFLPQGWAVEEGGRRGRCQEKAALSTRGFGVGASGWEGKVKG